MGSNICERAGFAGAEDRTTFALEMSQLMEGAYVTSQVPGNPETGAMAWCMIDMLAEKRLSTSK